MRCFYYTLSNFLQINIKYVNEIVLFNRIESSWKWIMENMYKARWEDKRDERVSGEMKGGNTEPDDWMNSIQRERESLLHIPMSEFFCCRPLDCLYSIKILLLLTCTGVGGEIDEQSSLLQMTCHERTPRETLLVTPHYIPSWTVKSCVVLFSSW